MYVTRLLRSGLSGLSWLREHTGAMTLLLVIGLSAALLLQHYRFLKFSSEVSGVVRNLQHVQHVDGKNLNFLRYHLIKNRSMLLEKNNDNIETLYPTAYITDPGWGYGSGVVIATRTEDGKDVTYVTTAAHVVLNEDDIYEAKKKSGGRRLVITDHSYQAVDSGIIC